MSWKVWDGRRGRHGVLGPFIRVTPNGKTAVSKGITSRLDNPIEILIDRGERKFAFRTSETGDLNFRSSVDSTVVNLAALYKELGLKIATSQRLYGKWSEDDGGKIVEFSVKELAISALPVPSSGS